jgi:hypothetical protein
VNDLLGAEGDAQRMFAALTAETLGGYCAEYSCLLLSPTLAQMREALGRLLSDHGPVDTFTLYFAGHGSVKTGSFYMWGRDVVESRLSMSALSLGDVFRMIAEVAPAQTNIIVDACESGGLINDLGVLLKADTLGNAHTPGVTLLATSAQDEPAMEEDGAGYGTSALLDCIEGREFVQDHTAVLDLVEIGRRVSSKLRASGQTPVVWGLNLSTAPRFCRNPFYSANPTSMQTFVTDWGNKYGVDLRSDQYESLWSIYSAIESNWNPRELANTVLPLFAELSDRPELLANFVLRLAASLAERAESTSDRFRSTEVVAVLAVALLPHLGTQVLANAAQRIVDDVFGQIAVTIVALNVAIASDSYALLSATNPISDLILLPIRITKILGWGALTLLAETISLASGGAARGQYAALVRSLLEIYRYSITPVSDTQASHWYICLSALKKLDLLTEAEEIFGMAFNGLVANQGKLLRANVTGEQTLDYILASDSKDFSTVVDAIKRPNETLTVFLRVAAALDLADVIDEHLWLLDGVGFTAYIKAEYSDFGDAVMAGGENFVWGIGYDIFRASEFQDVWPAIARPPTELVTNLSLLAALLYPDRVPWHCLNEEEKQS